VFVTTDDDLTCFRRFAGVDFLATIELVRRTVLFLAVRSVVVGRLCSESVPRRNLGDTVGSLSSFSVL
jgi:hypothetical protein